MKMPQTLSFLQIGFIFFQYNFLFHSFGLEYDRYHATDPCIQEHLHYTCTHIFSVSQHIALVGGVCDEEVWRDPMLMQDEPMRDEAIVDFPFTAMILVHDCF